MRNDLVIFSGRAFDDETLTRSDLKVLYHIGRFARRGDGPTQGWAWPSTRTLAIASGLSRSTVRHAITVLVAGHYLAVARSVKPDGSHGVNRYYVILDNATAHDPTYIPVYEDGESEETEAVASLGGWAGESAQGGGPENRPTVGQAPLEGAAQGGPVLPSQTRPRNGKRNGKQQTTSPAEAPVVRKLTWLTPFMDAWEAIMQGPSNPKLLARYTKLASDHLSPERALTSFTNYLRSVDPRYLNLHAWAQTCGRWEVAGVERQGTARPLHPRGPKTYDYSQVTTQPVTFQ
jgi:hypothetical protein